MKNLTKGLALLSMLSLFSCTKTIYTHEQVLNGYKTKQQVTQKFGVPTEKILSDTTDEWLYRYDGRKPADEYHNANTASVPGFGNYTRFLIFSFDKQGNVIQRNSQGVNLAEKKKNVVGTIFLIVGGLALIASAFIKVSF